MDKFETLQALIHQLPDRGKRDALVHFRREDAEVWSYAQLADHINRLSGGLIAHGLKPSEPVVLYAPSSPQWISACLAVLLTGAVVVPIDAQMSGEELRHVLKDSGAHWAFTTKNLAQRLDAVGPEHGLRHILLDAEEGEERSWQSYLACTRPELPIMAPDDLATLFYTSGTTGPPKGVPLTHRNLAANLQALLAQNLAHGDDRLLLPLPLHHVYPFTIGMLAPLALGAAVILPHALTGPQLQRALRDGRATIIVGVPRLYEALYSAIETQLRQRGRAVLALFRGLLVAAVILRRRLGLDLGTRLFGPLRARSAPHVRLVVSGGSALDPELAWKLEGLGWRVATGYGLTETSPILAVNLPSEARFDSAGRALPGVGIRISEPQPGTAHGEVLVRGPNVFAGYHNLPQKTREAFDDGWFRTGDLGYLDDDGYLHLVGRASEMIVLPGSENVNPEVVEETLQQGKHIREAGVLEHNGRLVAVIVPEPGAAREDAGQGTDDQLIRHDIAQQSRQMPSHRRIADYVISYDPLMRTRLGKIRRHKLKERYEQLKRTGGRQVQAPGPVPIERLAPEDQQLLQDPATRKVWNWLAARFRDVHLTPDTSPQLDLGVDSMEWLNLTLEVRDHTGVNLEDEAIGRIGTVRDLLREVVEAGRTGAAGADPVEQLRDPERLLDERQKRWLEPPGPLARAVGSLLLWLDRALLQGAFRLKVEGREHLPPEGPFVLAPNHTSMLDPLALGAALDKNRLWRTYWGGWFGIMFRNPLMRAASRVARVVPIDPHHGMLANLAFGVAALQRGYNLVWFPEGERSPSGQLQPFRPGIGLLLRAQPVPVVPVWIAGTYEVLPRGARWPRLRPITVTFGEPVDPRDLEAQGQGEEPHTRIANGLHGRVAELAQRAPLQV